MKKWLDIRQYGLALLLLTASPLTKIYAQQPGQSLFTDAQDVAYKDLNPLQQQNYNILASNPGAAYIKLVRFDLLSKVQDNGVVSINLPFLPCAKMKYRAKQVNFTSDDDYEWYGEIISNNDADTICSDGFLTMVNMTNDGGLMGTLVMNNFSAEIQDLSGGIKAFVVMDENKLYEGGCGYEPKVSTTLIDPAIVGGPYGGPLGPHVPVVIGGDDCVKKDVRVLVLYTSGAKDALPRLNQTNITNINEDARFAILESNTRLGNSGVPYRVVLAGAEELPGYVEQSHILDENEHIASYVPAQNLRTQYHADVVILMTKPDNFEKGKWGNTRNVGSYNPNAPNPLDPAYAYCVVDISRSHGAAGIFAHELGHALGARHDRAQDRNSLHISYLDEDARGYKFSRWYGFGFGARYRTVMTYGEGSDRRTPIPYYSNPDVIFAGTNAGTATDNNVAQIKQHYPLIGAFYTEPIGFANSFDVQFFTYPASSSGIKSPCKNYAKLTAQTNGCNLLSNLTHYWQTSLDGINWIDAGTGNTLTVNPTNPNVFVKLISTTRNPFISSVTYQHTLVFDCPGVIAPTAKRQQATEDNTINSIVVYPNPSNGKFTLKYNLDVEQKGQILLMDVSGKVLETVYSGILRTGQHDIELETMHKYRSGIYILKTQGETINYQTKITIQ